MLGFFPPSSNDSFLNFGAASLAIASPVTVPPVNVMASTPGFATKAAPALLPYPCTIFSTPSGKPISMHSSDSIYAVIGVISDGFATTQLPAARAGAIFHESKYSGRFQGDIAATTPRGCLIV